VDLDPMSTRPTDRAAAGRQPSRSAVDERSTTRSRTLRTRIGAFVVGAALIGAGAGAATALNASAGPPHQTSLADAASQAHGIGARRLASGLDGASRPDTDPTQVVGDTEAKIGGCETAYGKPGQCLPEVPPSQAEHVAMGHMQPHWECGEVRTMFAKGLKLRAKGVDPLGLDRNGDGTACGKGD
jgi:hypothetical protein